jgi:16S rRNA (uracil1498-N3)-methyltransferase
MHHFFIDPDLIQGEIALVTGPEAHHLRKVLRLEEGDQIRLFDGRGLILEAVIAKITRDRVEAMITTRRSATSAPTRVQISQALLKGNKMDLLIQKANELGIDVLEPFISARCENKSLNQERGLRWQRMILESCKQCGRPVPMACWSEINFSAMLKKGEDNLKIIFWEQEQEVTLSRLFTDQRQKITSVRAIIGPEGGFTAEEIDQAVAAGFLPVSLGRRTLRAETASLAAMAILQHRLGNLET